MRKVVVQRFPGPDEKTFASQTITVPAAFAVWGRHG